MFKIARLLPFAACALVLSVTVSSPVGAVVLDIQNNSFVFRDFRGPNPFPFFQANPDALVFSAKVNVDGAPPVAPGIPTVTRTSPITTADPMPFRGDPVIPNNFAESIPFDATLAGQPWTYSAVLGTDSTQRTVPALPSFVTTTPVPLATSASINGDGDVKWIPPSDPAINRLTIDILAGPGGLVLPDGTTAAPSRVIAQARGTFARDATNFNLSDLSDSTLFLNPTGYVPTVKDEFVIRLRNEIRDSSRTAPEDGDPIGSQISRSSTFISVNVPPPGTPDVFLPTVTGDGEFSFDVAIAAGDLFFFDPIVAVGFDYVVDGGPNFSSVLIPDPLPGGDAEFELFLPGFVSAFSLLAGTEFDLTALDPLGFNSFILRGIDPAEGLDPTDPLAFITGLRFGGTGDVSMRMIPITESTSVPEPGVLLLLAMGIVGAGYARRRRIH